MKKLLIFLLLFWLFSCSDSKKDDVWVVKETSQIISDYPDTLESTVKDARSVTEQQNNSNSTLEKQLQDARK